MHGIGILDGDVVERKMLGEGGDEFVQSGIEDGEDSGRRENQMRGLFWSDWELT